MKQTKKYEITLKKKPKYEVTLKKYSHKPKGKLS